MLHFTARPNTSKPSPSLELTLQVVNLRSEDAFWLPENAFLDFRFEPADNSLSPSLMTRTRLPDIPSTKQYIT